MNAPFSNRRRGMVHHHDLHQGSEEWHAARCGLLTASETKLILTPSLKIASNEKERAHLFELMAQRISNYVEPSYVGDNILRGWADEIDAREAYSKAYAPVQEIGFITNDKWGFTLGYSPDGLVGDDGAIEAKSRRQKFQVETIATQEVPAEFVFQLQTGLLVSERRWIDFISYSGGLPMVTLRVHPDPRIQDAILQAASDFEARLSKQLAAYHEALASDETRLIPTERKTEQEMFV